MKKKTAVLSAFLGSLTLSGCMLHHRDHGWHGGKRDGDRGERSDRGGRERGGRSGAGSGSRR